MSYFPKQLPHFVPDYQYPRHGNSFRPPSPLLYFAKINQPADVAEFETRLPATLPDTKDHLIRLEQFLPSACIEPPKTAKPLLDELSKTLYATERPHALIASHNDAAILGILKQLPTVYPGLTEQQIICCQLDSLPNTFVLDRFKNNLRSLIEKLPPRSKEPLVLVFRIPEQYTPSASDWNQIATCCNFSTTRKTHIIFTVTPAQLENIGKKGEEAFNFQLLNLPHDPASFIHFNQKKLQEIQAHWGIQIGPRNMQYLLIQIEQKGVSLRDVSGVFRSLEKVFMQAAGSRKHQTGALAATENTSLPGKALGRTRLDNLVAQVFSTAKTQDSKHTPLSKWRVQSPTTHFNAVIGQTQAKRDLQEIVEYLKLQKRKQELQTKGRRRTPEEIDLDDKLARMKALNLRLKGGTLLEGPPGNGKTELVRAIAGEAGIPVFVINGSEFVEMHVGKGAARVREAFVEARRNKPCIVFIDEIDAFAKKRGMSRDNEEQEQTLNQLLVELDGFHKEDAAGIIFIASTNRKDILDDALLRPPRLATHVKVEKPNRTERKQFLEYFIHKDNIRVDGVDYDDLSHLSGDFSGADMQNWLTTAGWQSYRSGRNYLTLQDFIDSFAEIKYGTPRPELISQLTPQERRQVAYHELGHGLTAKVCGIDPFMISMIPTGDALGYVLPDPRKLSEFTVSRETFLKRILISAAGQAAESYMFNHQQTTSMASGDLGEIEKLFRQLRSQGLMDDGIIDDVRDEEKPLCQEDKRLLSIMIANAKRINTALLKLVPGNNLRWNDFITHGGTLTPKEAVPENQFRKMADIILGDKKTPPRIFLEADAKALFEKHLQGYDWQKANRLLESFLKHPTGNLLFRTQFRVGSMFHSQAHKGGNTHTKTTQPGPN